MYLSLLYFASATFVFLKAQWSSIEAPFTAQLSRSNYEYVNVYLMQKHLRYKKVRPTKVELYLKMNARTGWWQQNLISEYNQNLAYWTHEYYTGHIITS